LATSRAAAFAELSALLGTETTKSAEVSSGNLIATSLAWTRLVEIRPGVEQELLDGRFMLSDFRDVARASIKVSLKRGDDGQLLPPGSRIVRDDDFNIAGAVDAAVHGLPDVMVYIGRLGLVDGSRQVNWISKVPESLNKVSVKNGSVIQNS
jgi:hypothetical protein